MPHFFKRLCIGATLFLYTGLLPLIAHPTPPDARLSRDIAALPVYDAAPSDRIPYDWLIHPNRSRSGVYRTPDGQGIVVANDMVSRTFASRPPWLPWPTPTGCWAKACFAPSATRVTCGSTAGAGA